MAPAASPRHHPPPETNLADPVGPLMFQRLLSMRDPAFDPDGATPSRIAMAHVLPSCTGTHSASVTFILTWLNPAPCMAPVYTSDPALPRRPQDSVPTCPLRLWPDETFTHKSSAAFPNALRQAGGDSGLELRRHEHSGVGGKVGYRRCGCRQRSTAWRIVLRPERRYQALRLRRTAARLRGLTAALRPRVWHPCLRRRSGSLEMG